MKRKSNASQDGTEFYGFLVDLLEIIKEELGSKFPQYVIQEDETGLYGINTDDKGRDDTWNGIAGVLEAVSLSKVLTNHQKSLSRRGKPRWDLWPCQSVDQGT